MNVLDTYVLSCQKQEGISFVKLDYQGKILSAMSLGAEYKQGQPMQVLFKESDVMVAQRSSSCLSARNKFLSPITCIQQNSILARIYFDFGCTQISSLISFEACDELNLKQGEIFLWFVKSSDLVLQEI